MGEMIRIGAEEGAPGLGATVDTTGAWVADLGAGEDNIFYPRFINPEGKFRGGMHVCLPYFGLPDRMKRSGNPQHGYAREVEWDLKEEPNAAQVTLTHMAVNGEFSGLSSTITYGISEANNDSPWDHSFYSTIRFDATDGYCVVAPGFHPYFSGLIGFDDLEPDYPVLSFDGIATHDKRRVIQLQNTAGYAIELVTEGMDEAVNWSDNPDKYVCVEPICTMLDPFTDANRNSYLLRPADHIRFDLIISIRKIKVT